MINDTMIDWETIKETDWNNLQSIKTAFYDEVYYVIDQVVEAREKGTKRGLESLTQKTIAESYIVTSSRLSAKVACAFQIDPFERIKQTGEKANSWSELIKYKLYDYTISELKKHFKNAS